MNTIEMDRALRRLRLSGMAATLDTRILEAQTSNVPPLDFLSGLVNDELQRRQDRLIERRIKKANGNRQASHFTENPLKIFSLDR